MLKTYETAPVHPDFAPPWHALSGYPLPWEWIAILEQPSGNLIAMAINPAQALEIIAALQAQEARRQPADYEHAPLAKIEPTSRASCREAGCANAAMPGQDYCVRHLMTY